MRTYLVAFYNQRGPSNPVGGGIDPLLEFLNARGDLFNDWMILFRQVVLLKTDLNAKKISALIRGRFTHSLFLVSELANDHEGWLPEDAWKFLRR